MWDRQSFMTTIQNKQKHVLFCFYRFRGNEHEKKLKEQTQSNIPPYIDVHFIEMNSEYVLYETLMQKKILYQYPCFAFYSKENVTLYPNDVLEYMVDEPMTFRKFLKKCNKMS